MLYPCCKVVFLRALLPVLAPYYYLSSRLFHPGATPGIPSYRVCPGDGRAGKSADTNPDTLCCIAPNRYRYTNSNTCAEISRHLDADCGTHGHANCRTHPDPRAGAFSHAPAKRPIGFVCHSGTEYRTDCLF